MEDKMERTFAYNLAKVVDNDSLAAVSGGASSLITHGPTFKASGGPGPDVILDHNVDW